MKRQHVCNRSGLTTVSVKRRWAMLKMTRIAAVSATLAVGVGTLLTAFATPACGLTTSDKPAAILVWPKVVVDTSGAFGAPTETVIQLTNTTNSPRLAHCFYVDANGHCAAPLAGKVCQSAADCEFSTGMYTSCEAACSEEDFDIVLTAGQPVGWPASTGLKGSSLIYVGRCVGTGTPCISDLQCFRTTCDLSNTNIGTGVPPVPEDPFVGSLTCIEYSAGASPTLDVSSGTLKGEGTIEIAALSGPPQIEIYNAVGLQGTGQSPASPGVLQIGGTPNAPGSYGACSTALILDHRFDTPGACSTNGMPCASDADCAGGTCEFTEPESSLTDLTLVPCGNNLLTQNFGKVTAQFVVYNEFEQRFSASHSVPCFFESFISHIDTPFAGRSIFSQAVSGSIFGQTRIRGVGSADTGRGLIGVARVANPALGGSGAYNLWQQGNPCFAGDPLCPSSVLNPDVITIP
jgi:hypothetical protein